MTSCKPIRDKFLIGCSSNCFKKYFFPRYVFDYVIILFLKSGFFGLFIFFLVGIPSLLILGLTFLSFGIASDNWLLQWWNVLRGFWMNAYCWLYCYVHSLIL
ncbi:hypothetical protein HanLR1_Chr04g0158181 [Helianthus annuus]|nr:hypothetical protein HanLR1_Chr04g0158181 [Helianthus annuus]